MGMNDARISEVRGESELDIARSLFEEYAREIDVDLCFQGFADELANLSSMYAPPGGGILLAHGDDGVLGCVGFRRLAPDTCEMKRLYVRPAARGSHLGRRLVLEIIDRARAAGYERMVLDTLPRMKAARSLYRSLGFEEVSPYYDNPTEGVLYMELPLREGFWVPAPHGSIP